MHLATPENFAAATGIGVRSAQLAFQKAADDKPWKGFQLPVIAVKGQSTGRGGKVWALPVEPCPEELKAKLEAIEAPFEAPIQGALKGAVAPWQWDPQEDWLRIIAPILDTPKRTPERAEAFQSVAGQSHIIRGVPTQLAENTLCDWVRAREELGTTGLMPAKRADKGAARVLITREWDLGIDLPVDQRATIAKRAAWFLMTEHRSGSRCALPVTCCAAFQPN